MHIYESHHGGHFYSSDEEYGYDILYCDTCGDSDFYFGFFDCKEEFLDYMLNGSMVDYYGREFIIDQADELYGGD